MSPVVRGGFASRWQSPFWRAASAAAHIIGGSVSTLPLPPGIYFGNGRLEADEINIDTKYAARIAEILVDEGDLVKAGQVVARMDTRDLAASLKKSEAQVRQARRAVDEADANVAQQKTQLLLAQQEYRSRRSIWCKKGSRPRRSWISGNSNWTAPTPRSMPQALRVIGNRARARSRDPRRGAL